MGKGRYIMEMIRWFDQDGGAEAEQTIGALLSVPG